MATIRLPGNKGVGRIAPRARFEVKKALRQNSCALRGHGKLRETDLGVLCESCHDWVEGPWLDANGEPSGKPTSPEATADTGES